MKTCQRLNIETGLYETVDLIGRVKFVGESGNADLTHNKIYNVIGIRNNMLKLIDDTEDYYLYLPQDGTLILEKKATGAGFIIIDDFTKTKEIKKVFDIAKKNLIKQERSLKNRIIKFIMNKKNKSVNLIYFLYSTPVYNVENLGCFLRSAFISTASVSSLSLSKYILIPSFFRNVIFFPSISIIACLISSALSAALTIIIISPHIYYIL